MCDKKRKIRVVKVIRKRDPVVFTGKMLRELSEDPNFTLADFKKRFSLK